MKTLNTLDPLDPSPQVVKTVVGGGPWTVYGAWKLDPEGICGGYSSITTGVREDGSIAVFGRLGTERLPEAMRTLRGEERYVKVRVWQLQRWADAYDVIEAEVSLPRGSRDMGEISTH